MLEIVEASSDLQLRDFVHLPWKVHRHNPHWVPPLIHDETKLFSPQTNPAFTHCTTVMYLAIEDGVTVGRTMGIIHRPYNQLSHQRWARFGFIECFDDPQVFDALISSVEAWARKYGCDKLVGPFGFSDKDPQGFLSMGFDHPSTIVANCNMPYMVDLAKGNGLIPFIDLVQYKVPISDRLLEKLKPYSDRVLRNNPYKIIEFTKTREIKPYVREVFSVMNTAYRDIFGFSPITIAEADEFGDRFLPFLKPDLLKVVTDQYNQVLAFVVAMPDMSEGLRRSNGKLYPFGWWHILRSMKKNKRFVLLLGAVDAPLRNKGLDAALGYHVIKSALANGFTEMDSHLIMESNIKMRREIERLDGMELYKRYTIYEKPLVP